MKSERTTRILDRLRWRLRGRPHWNVYEGHGHWGGSGRCQFCAQYALLQFEDMAECPIGPHNEAYYKEWQERWDAKYKASKEPQR